MAGVWVFRNGVARLVQNPLVEALEDGQNGGRRKVLVYVPSNQVIGSYADLESKLVALGWRRYPHNSDPDTLQFHKSHASLLLISLPRDFRRFKTMHMYDIVLKNRGFFEVRDYP